MSTKDWNRREFLCRLSQSALTLAVLGRASQQVAASTGKSTSVLVLGAGISGLYTALLLEARGISVTVLEARDRVGGRIYTLDDLPGKPEAGVQSFSSRYQRLLALVEDLQVPVKDRKRFKREILLHVNGKSILPQNWAKSEANLLPLKERNIIPSRLLRHYLRSNNPLEDAQAWIKSKHFALDIPLDKYLRANGASNQAIQLMEPNSLVNSIENTSALWALKKDQLAQSRGKPMGIKNGNSRLPEKMAAALKSRVQTSKVVVSISTSSTGVEIQCKDGSFYQADYVVVTLPFSVLRQVEITPPLPERQAEAVQKLQYTAVTQIRFTVPQPFWEKDGYPPTMWTDSSLQRIFPIREDSGKIASWVCWVNGKDAQKLDAMSTGELNQFFKSELKRIRPAMAENMEILKVVSWGKDPYSRGAYSHFAPGDIRRFRDVMARSWGRIHFAGEHTAVSSPGMESALESAQRVANEIFAVYHRSI